MDYELRPADKEHLPFLHELRRETMREYVVATWGDWDEEHQQALFDAGFDPAAVQIVVVDRKPVGMFRVELRESNLFLRQIAIASLHRGRGIGSDIVRTFTERAESLQVPLTLDVLKVNPARALYERLGLHVVFETDTHYLMSTEKPRESEADL